MIHFCLYRNKINLGKVAGTRKGRGVSLRPWNSLALFVFREVNYDVV